MESVYHFGDKNRRRNGSGDVVVSEFALGPSVGVVIVVASPFCHIVDSET